MSRRTDARNGSEDSYSTTTSVDRRTVLRSGAAGAAAIGGMALAGCIGGGGGAEYQATIISSPAGFDDAAFNDNALSGLEEAAEEWDINVNTVETEQGGEFAQRQADAAESGPDLIVMVGDQHTTPLGGEDGSGGNAAEYPDVNWMLINNHVPQDNVSGWIEMNHQMSFLAGVGAGTLTHEEIENAGSSTNPDESTVGFVGGEEIPLIQAFERSYIQGVEWVDDSIEVLTGYGGSFSDPSGVNDQATSQIESGADIVWHAASAAGEGAFSAASDNGVFAIGVDTDQSVSFSDYEDVILGSAIKALNEATYEVAQAVVEDNWESVQGEQNLSVSGGQIDWVTGQAFGGLPDSLDQNMEEAKTAIENDEIDFECGPTSC